MADLIDRAAVLEKLQWIADVFGRDQDGEFYVGEEAACFAGSVLNDAMTIIAALPAQGVRVKPLVWEAGFGGLWHTNRGKGSDRLNYEAGQDKSGAWWSHSSALPHVKWGPFPTLEAAKAAAQADYEARILAALAPAEAGGVPAWLSNCVVCGRIVDTREKDDGGDGHGCEYPEGWTCSSECAEKLHPDPEWMKDALAAEAGGVEGRPDAPCHIVEYTNWRGETARRTIIPIRMWWGKTEWHPQEQWMLTAWDVEKEATRDFAWQDMKPVQNGATSAAVAALRAARESALREALVALQGAGSFGRTASEKHAALEQYCLCRDAILALIGEKP